MNPQPRAGAGAGGASAARGTQRVRTTAIPPDLTQRRERTARTTLNVTAQTTPLSGTSLDTFGVWGLLRLVSALEKVNVRCPSGFQADLLENEGVSRAARGTSQPPRESLFLGGFAGIVLVAVVLQLPKTSGRGWERM